MKKTLFVLAVSCILFATASSDRPLVSSPQSFNRSGIQDRLPVLKSQPGGNPAGLHVDFGSLPLYFTANRGQVDGRALFYAKASRYTLWLTEAGLVFDSYKFERPEPPVAGKGPSLRAEKPESRKSERDVSRLIFLNGAKHPQIVAVDESPLKVNYFIGNDPAKWHAAVPTSKAVLYKNIYKNIDLKVYGSEGRIEYDWIVRPGGDPRDIKFEYRNVKGTRLDEEGNLLVETNFGELMHKKPAAFQERVGKPAAEKRSGKSTRAAVESAFKKIGANAYGFEVGAYQADLELIIDPVVLAYSSYLGGSGTDNAYGIAVDGSGNAYVTGETYSTDFPTLNQYQTDQGVPDAFIAKIAGVVADIAVTKTATNLTPRVGEAFNFTVTVTNNGPATASGLKVTDSLPAGLTYVSSTASTGTYISGTGIWDIGALANGATATLTIGVSGSASGMVTNRASVSALNENDPNAANDSDSVNVMVKNIYSLTIATGAGGTTNPVPGTYTYVEGTSVSVQATASAGYRFSSWSGDASGTTNPITIKMTGNKTVTANFIRQYTLTIAAGAGGTTSPVPGAYTYDEGTSVSVQATASAGYRFGNWSGDASGSANPVTLVMNGNKAIQANFTRVVKAPLNLTAEKLVNRNVSLIEYIARLRWQPNPENAGMISYRIYRIENGQAATIADVAAGTYEYIVRRLQATKAYLFGVTAVDSQGWESDMVEIAVQ